MYRSDAPIPFLCLIGAAMIVLAVYCIRTGTIPHGRRRPTIRSNNPEGFWFIIIALSVAALVSFGLAILVWAEGGALTR